MFGTSSGATFALCMLVRHPHAVRGAILHEPGLARLYDDPEAVAAAGRELMRTGMEAGGPREALRRFFLLVGGEANWDALDASLRDRMLDTAETFLDVERGTFEGYLPTDDLLAAITAPVQILVSEHGRAPQQAAARRLADRLGVGVSCSPGTHLAYLDHPRELAVTIRPFLRQLSGVAAVTWTGRRRVAVTTPGRVRCLHNRGAIDGRACTQPRSARSRSGMIPAGAEDRAA